MQHKTLITFLLVFTMVVLKVDHALGASTEDRLFEPKRRTVIEEGTGMWCGYCPLGIIAMKRMHEKYPDEFIGIAVHYNDVLEVDAYSRALDFESFPIGSVNRKVEVPPMVKVQIDDKVDYTMQYGGFETFFLQEQEKPTVADVSVSAVLVGQQLEINAETRFAESFGDSDYRLTFVVVEDQVAGEGFYQTNYFNGATGYTLDGFDEMPYKIYPFTFDDVAIAVADPVTGIEGSVPCEIEAGERYAFSHQMEVPRLNRPEHARVVAMLLDANTGEVVNANQCELTVTGVGVIAPNASQTTNIYDLSGKQVVRPTPASIYIQNGKKVFRTKL